MANYTLTNLKQVEDQAPKGGLSPNLTPGWWTD